MTKKILSILTLGLSLIYYSCSNISDIVITSYSDGPYILAREDSTLIIFQNPDYTFDSLKISNVDIEHVQFQCNFDSINCPPLTFHLNQDMIETNDSVSLPEKLLAISDIEGNFEKYYQLLISNNVIDTNYNWIFGNGHLVIVGDLVDRGDYVTQCLWLTYHLEQEAVKHGGKVHYLLGNHEQIDLLGYDVYCSPKYLGNYKKIHKNINQLFDSNTELGSWLRDKNSILKTGNLIFVHGGISPTLLKYDLSLQKINSEIQRDIATQDFKTDESSALLTEEGILWYRGLIEPNEGYEKISEEGLDKILNSFDCKTIIVGHTPVDSISQDFNGKVIRLDVDHYENSSALLIENNKKYIVDIKGNKIEL